EVPLFEQQGPYATGGGIQSDPRPGNASPDHDQIIGFPQNLLKGLLSVHIGEYRDWDFGFQGSTVEFVFPFHLAYTNLVVGIPCFDTLPLGLDMVKIGLP